MTAQLPSSTCRQNLNTEGSIVDERLDVVAVFAYVRLTKTDRKPTTENLFRPPLIKRTRRNELTYEMSYHVRIVYVTSTRNVLL